MADETTQHRSSGEGRPAGRGPGGPGRGPRPAGGRGEGAGGPRKYFRRKKVCKFCVEKIDAISLDLMTLPRNQWDKLGEKLGRFKNPKTGQYTMAEAVKCPHCREKIPMPQLPDAPKLSAEDIKAKRMPPGFAEYQAELKDIWGKYKCPKCGQLWGPYGTPPAF